MKASPLRHEAAALFVLEENMKNRVQKTVCAALCLALALVLPFLTAQIPQIGSMLSPMHIPVLLCGFVCGAQWGTAVGLIAPILRSLFFGMPPMFPSAAAMAAELAVYGLLSGLLYRVLPKKTGSIYIALIAAMLGGRIAWGIVRWIFAGLQGTGFAFSAFLAGAVTNGVPGIILQIILVPALVMALRRANLISNPPSER